MNDAQKTALAAMPKEWAKCPTGIKSPTLLWLRDKGHIEIRLDPEIGVRGLGHPYTSIFYQVRANSPSAGAVGGNKP